MTDELRKAGTRQYRRFRTLLIANRGEIAVRVIRTARAMGLRTVAVYSEADRGAMHVAMADEAVLLGLARARDSYLNIERVIDAARQSGAEAVHPGYGFLSESAEFAQACLDAGLVFVGPTAGMIRAMGSKSGSKMLMEKAGVPLVPGYHGEAQDEATLAKAAGKVGFPVLVKASAGGGGRGMRIVRSAGELAAAVVSARREAKAAFGDDRMLIEKFVENPRHIEVQIIGDSHGNLLSLFERECTLQRRHQKVIEEAPSPTLDATKREAVCAAARKAAAAVNYVGAGTIEFVSNGKDVFFIEMNTRLQVEHPVTEAITGIDLVEWQLRVARGEAFTRKQESIRFSGHAIEARLCAEDPARNFLPQAGRQLLWQPDSGVRTDHALESGAEISPHYDSMIAKVIARGATRSEARERLARALDSTVLLGITTNKAFLAGVLRDEEFAARGATTDFLNTRAARIETAEPDAETLGIAGALLAADAGYGEWNSWSNNPARAMRAKFNAHEVSLRHFDGAYRVEVGDTEVMLRVLSVDPPCARIALDRMEETIAFRIAGGVHLARKGQSHSLENTVHAAAKRATAASDGRLVA